jgi:hypothetical protein
MVVASATQNGLVIEISPVAPMLAQAGRFRKPGVLERSRRRRVLQVMQTGTTLPNRKERRRQAALTRQPAVSSCACCGGGGASLKADQPVPESKPAG